MLFLTAGLCWLFFRSHAEGTASHRHEYQEADAWKPSQKAADNRMVLSIDLGKEHAAEGKSKCKDKGMFE